jgi:hypothetical protein
MRTGDIWQGLTSWRLWRHPVGIGVTLFGVSALVALSVVSSVRGADTLSVVALTLAILAFLVQIVVFIAQTLTSTQLNSQTARVLDEVQDLLGKRFDYLLRNAVERTSLEIEDSEDVPIQPADVANYEERLRDNFDALLRQQDDQHDGLRTFLGGKLPRTRPVGTDEDATLARMRSWPGPDEAPGLARQYKALSPEARIRFQRYVEREVLQRSDGRTLGLRSTSSDDQPDPITQELVAAGLLEMKPGNAIPGVAPAYQLTPVGREVGRLIAGNPLPVPQAVTDALRSE